MLVLCLLLKGTVFTVLGGYFLTAQQPSGSKHALSHTTTIDSLVNMLDLIKQWNNIVSVLLRSDCTILIPASHLKYESQVQAKPFLYLLLLTAVLFYDWSDWSCSL